MSSFKGIYISQLRKENNLKEKISCGIGCGKRSTKEMWLEFFTGEDDKLVLQISDDGTKANTAIAEGSLAVYTELNKQ